MWKDSLTAAYEVFECDRNTTLDEVKSIYLLDNVFRVGCSNEHS